MAKKNKFYSLLEWQANYAAQASNLFLHMTSDFQKASQYIAEIDDTEHKADQVRHELASLIDNAFITPMDKEDITDLADKLDDITDCIESATGRILIYDVETLRSDLAPMVSNLNRMTSLLQSIVSQLGQKPDRAKLNGIFISLHEIENETDEMFRSALGNLFKTMKSQPVEIIIWKEIYDRVERAVDKCEHAANVIESMVVKYA